MRQEKDKRSNRQDEEQAQKRSRATRNANAMANDLLSTPLDPNHDYAHDIELGTYVDARERYDHLYGETVPNVNQVEFGKEAKAKQKASQVEFAKEQKSPSERRDVEFGKEANMMDLQERTNRSSTRDVNRDVNRETSGQNRSMESKPHNRASMSNKK